MSNIFNKKGENDLIEIIIGLFVVAFLGFMVVLVILNVTPAFRDFTTTGSLADNAIVKAGGTFTSGLDNLFVGIFVILVLGMIILSLYISANPIFIPIYLIIASISVWFAAIISNAYMEIEASGVFNSVLDYFPKQNFIMENLPYFTAGLAFILLIVTYSKDLFGGFQNYK
jgi:hypothetical protein